MTSLLLFLAFVAMVAVTVVIAMPGTATAPQMLTGIVLAFALFCLWVHSLESLR